MSGRRICKTLFSVSLLIISWGLVFPWVCCGQDRVNQNWAAQVEQKRKEAAGKAAKDPKSKKTPAPSEGTAVIGGKKIKVRTIATPTPAAKPAPKAKPAAASEPAAATSEMEAATMTPTATPTITATPTVTPTFIKVKKPKLVNGKIVMVEVEVTPTPGPAEVASSTATSASASVVIPATGEMAELRDQLFAAIKSASKPTQFTPKQTAKIREEFLAATTKRKDQIKGILAATRTIELQIKVTRLAANTKGGTIDSPTARDLVKIIWPKYAHQLDQAKAKAKAVIDSGSPEVSEEEDIFLEEDEEETEYGEEREVYIDPDTGKYVYEDGTLVETSEEEEAPPPPPPVYQAPVVYEPPPERRELPPPPPPINEGNPPEQGPIEESGEFVEQDNNEVEYEEDPALQEEPQEPNEEEFIQPDDSEIQEYQEENYTEFDENDLVEQQ